MTLRYTSLLALVVVLSSACVVEDDLGDRPDDQADGAGSGGSGAQGTTTSADGESDETGEDTSPSFAEPLVAGLVLDLSESKCADVRLVIDDPDDSRVEISVTDSPEGARLVQDGDLTANWTWCPTAAQVAEEPYTMTFVADDEDNDPVSKEFVVALRS